MCVYVHAYICIMVLTLYFTRGGGDGRVALLIAPLHKRHEIDIFIILYPGDTPCGMLRAMIGIIVPLLLPSFHDYVFRIASVCQRAN